MQGNIEPYKLPLFGGNANLILGTIVTPNNYIASYIQGQKTTICFSILFILFPAFNWCQTSNAKKHLERNQIAMLQNALNYVNTLNWVTLILLVSGSIYFILVIITILSRNLDIRIWIYNPELIANVFYLAYTVINIVNYCGQKIGRAHV